MGRAVHYPALEQRVLGQKKLQPGLYGDVDFTLRPHRLATQPEDVSSLPAWVADREPILRDDRVIELMSTATMLGDTVADPYATLMSSHSFKGLIDMLQLACSDGLDAVPAPPPELVTFIESMEREPDWLDMELVRRGQRTERIPAAFIAPFATRGAFVATFMNTYAALPMALTGALGGRKASRRVNETSAYFTTTVMPGGLERFAPGFHATAMVRLMHSMVRYNALKRSERWDLGVYGIPVPQVDQMPAGLLSVYLLSVRALRSGRTEWNDRERAVAELSRYRCHLLGLPEELLPATAEETIHLMHARAATLRDDFDDATCGELVRATMAAYLRADDTPFDRAAEAVERSYGKAFFVRSFAGGDRKKAKQMGVSFGATDVARIAVTAPFIVGRAVAVTAASRVPGLKTLTDNYAIRMLKKRLATYGAPEFKTDAAQYKPVAKPVLKAA